MRGLKEDTTTPMWEGKEKSLNLLQTKKGDLKLDCCCIKKVRSLIFNTTKLTFLMMRFQSLCIGMRE